MSDHLGETGRHPSKKALPGESPHSESPCPCPRFRPDDPDAEDGARAACGDEAAARRLHDKYCGYIFSIARLRLRNDALAKDAADAAMIDVFQNLVRFEGGSLFSTWVYRVAGSRISKFSREKPMESLERVDEETLFEAARSSELSPEESFEHRRIFLLLVESLLHAPPEQAIVLVLRHLVELSISETAQVLHVSQGAVKERDLRGKDAIRPRILERLPWLKRRLK